MNSIRLKYSKYDLCRKKILGMLTIQEDDIRYGAKERSVVKTRIDRSESRI